MQAVAPVLDHDLAVYDRSLSERGCDHSRWAEDSQDPRLGWAQGEGRSYKALGGGVHTCYKDWDKSSEWERGKRKWGMGMGII